MPDFLTVPVVAAELDVKEDVVRNWIGSGALPATNVASATGPGHRPSWRISRAELDRFLRARQTRPLVVTDRRRKARRSEVIEFF